MDVTKTYSSPKISIVIPTYNEESTIELVIKEIKSLNLNTVVIVSDGGSFDGTVQIAKELGASIIEERGIGRGISFEQALRNGLKAISSDTSVVVMLDADGQFSALKIPELIKPIIEGKADVVLGSTYQSSSLLSKISMTMLRFINMLFRLMEITDPFTTLRAYSLNAIKTLELEKKNKIKLTELTLNPAKAQLRFQEIPATKRLRHGRQRMGFRTALKLYKEIILEWIKS